MTSLRICSFLMAISSFGIPNDAFVMMLLWKEEKNDHVKSNIREIFMGEQGLAVCLVLWS